MSNFEELSKAVIAGQEQKVKELTQLSINEGVDPLSIINDGLIQGMNVVGQRFKVGDMFVPEVLMSARAMSAGVAMVKPLLLDGQMTSKGTVVIGTVKGDLHDIGKNLVGMMLESSGYQVIDMGVDTASEEFIAAVKENKAQVLGLSALLTTTMLSMKDTIEALKEEGIRNDVKVLIGGAPISQTFADEIGADGFAPDAASATELVGRLIG
ncbi:cobalamin B12-binding domain-containing protein [Paradesulfitobacterium ferrireducens]|uniref:cobalamin B12-binding domain-containing protein n=1 Tax=Paradesulfitobacterium ferrireducens TaxID=2816476 RepID=UPI001A8DDEFD|nr:corrinoid protein [Paradesulfitobacterium ferrireducens]